MGVMGFRDVPLNAAQLAVLRGSARVLAHFWCCLLCAFSVRFLYGVAESGHVQVTSGGPVVVGDVSDSCTDEHQGAPTIGESAHDAGPATYLAVESPESCCWCGYADDARPGNP
jgi:hypothetical protein